MRGKVLDQDTARWGASVDIGPPPTQNFVADTTAVAAYYDTNYGFLAGALASVVVAAAAALALLWGWWELWREVSMSPIETMLVMKSLHTGAEDMSAQNMSKVIGNVRIVYRPAPEQ